MCDHQGVGDATPAIFVALIMFAIPGTKEGGPLLHWKLVQVRGYKIHFKNDYCRLSFKQKISTIHKISFTFIFSLYSRTSIFIFYLFSTFQILMFSLYHLIFLNLVICTKTLTYHKFFGSVYSFREGDLCIIFYLNIIFFRRGQHGV